MSDVMKNVIVVASLLMLLLLGLWGLGDALIPLLFSFGLAYLVFPIIRKLEVKGVSRAKSVFAVFTLMVSLVVLISYLILPSLISDAINFSKELPAIATKAADKVEVLAEQFGMSINLSKEGIQGYVNDNRDEFTNSFSAGAAKWAKGIFSGFTKWILGIINLFLIPLFFFYIVNDFEKIIVQVKSFIPVPIQPKIKHYMSLTNTVLSGYIRGQLMVALLLGVLYAVGLSIVGLKFGLLIGLLAGFISIIPYAGFSIGFFIALIVELANYSGVGSILAVAVVFIIVQALEGTIITPKLVGDKVGLSSLATMLALIVGGNLFGIVGMILAIPVAAILKFALIELKNEFHQLEFNKNN